jgi:hypothetical protein
MGEQVGEHGMILIEAALRTMTSLVNSEAPLMKDEAMSSNTP